MTLPKPKKQRKTGPDCLMHEIVSFSSYQVVIKHNLKTILIFHIVLLNASQLKICKDGLKFINVNILHIEGEIDAKQKKTIAELKKEKEELMKKKEEDRDGG